MRTKWKRLLTYGGKFVVLGILILATFFPTTNVFKTYNAQAAFICAAQNSDGDWYSVGDGRGNTLFPDTQGNCSNGQRVDKTQVQVLLQPTGDYIQAGVTGDKKKKVNEDSCDSFASCIASVVYL